MSKEGFAGAAAPEVRTKFLGDIKVSQVAWRRQPEKCLLTFERTPLEDAVRCWFTREKEQANFFQKKSHREQAAPANRQQLLRTAFLGTIGREAAKAKATRQLALQQPKGWFGSPTAPRLGAFVSFPHHPLEGPPQARGGSGTGEGLCHSQAELGELRDLQESTSLPHRAPRRAQSRELLLQIPFHKQMLLKTPWGSQVNPSTYAGAATGPRCLLGEGAGK